jgi:hypothetical protein
MRMGGLAANLQPKFAAVSVNWKVPVRPNHVRVSGGVSQTTEHRCAVALIGPLIWACQGDIHLGVLETTGQGGANGAATAGASSGGAGEAKGGFAGGGSPDGAAAGSSARAGNANLLWHAEFESADLSEWTSDGQGANYRSSEPVAPVITSERAHTGTQALKVSISVEGGMTSANYMYRQATTPVEAYYSAWFLIPQNYTVKDWWNILHFVGSQTGDGRNEVSLWDVDLRSTTDGSLGLYVYEFGGSKQHNPVAARAFPIGVWVQLEVLFRKASDSTGRFAVYQDGALLIDVSGVRTAPNDWLRWAVGSASSNIAPTPADLYVDDAAISLARVSP